MTWCILIRCSFQLSLLIQLFLCRLGSALNQGISKQLHTAADSFIVLALMQSFMCSLCLIHSHIRGSHLCRDAKPFSHLIALSSCIGSDDSRLRDTNTHTTPPHPKPNQTKPNRAPLLTIRHAFTCTCRVSHVTPGWRHAMWHVWGDAAVTMRLKEGSRARAGGRGGHRGPTVSIVRR